MTDPSSGVWADVDRFIEERVAPSDPILDAALRDAHDAGLPAISVSPSQGKLLTVLARAINARRVLEVGTLAGYSTIWLARGLPTDGRIVTLEFDPKHAAVARTNFQRAKLATMIDVRVGAAIDTLPAIAAEKLEPFDLVFIDADKVNTPEYFDWALKLTRPGALIVVDNVVRNGKLADPDSHDVNVRGMQRFMDLLARHSNANRVVASAVQTVGSKGYDGFAIALTTGM
jgi:predicted O-methyltransferase YrrM